MFRNLHLRLFCLLVIVGSLTITATTAQPLIPLPRQNTQLLLNNGFETLDGEILANWGMIHVIGTKSNVRKCNQDTDNDGTPDVVVAHGGDCAYLLRGGGGLQQEVTDFSTFSDGITVTLSAYVKPQGAVEGTKFGTAIINYSDGSKTKLRLQMPAWNGNNYRYVKVTKPIDMPAGVTITSLTVRFLHNAIGKYWLDDVNLVTGSNVAQKLVASDAGGIDEFGSKIALGDDTLLVSGSNKNVYVFTRTSGVWAEQTILKGNHPSWGYELAVDNNTALITGVKNSTQVVKVYTGSGSTWTVQQTIKAPVDRPDPSSAFGPPFIDLDTDSAVMSFWGSPYIYTRTGTTWTQQALLLVAENFITCDVSIEGDTVVAGGFLEVDDVNNITTEKAYIFKRSGTTWALQAEIAFDDLDLGAFTHTVLSGDTAMFTTSELDQINKVYVYDRVGDTWTRGTDLTADDGATANSFGTAIALTGDTALISDYSAKVGYLFTRTGGVWSQTDALSASDASSSGFFGEDVALDPTQAFISAPIIDGLLGAVYVFPMP